MFYSMVFRFAELGPSFVPRDVVIKRGVNAKDAYEMVTEIGR